MINLEQLEAELVTLRDRRGVVALSLDLLNAIAVGMLLQEGARSGAYPAEARAFFGHMAGQIQTQLPDTAKETRRMLNAPPRGPTGAD